MTDWTSELEFARHLADVADAISMPFFRRGPRQRTKADGTIVTEADEAVERALRAELRAAYPEHAILGEEEGATGVGDMRWFLDPIDGTRNYSWGIPVWGTLVALEAEGEIVVGVVSAPAIGELYEASRGGGARLNGEPIAVSGIGEISSARIAFGDIKAFEAHGLGETFGGLVRSAHATRGLSDFWGHMLVACGSVEVMAEPVVNPWDLAPLIVIVEEAGGRLTDLAGARRIDGGSVLSTNGHLHEEALAFFTT